jgi:hypothetical protein
MDFDLPIIKMLFSISSEEYQNLTIENMNLDLILNIVCKRFAMLAVH